MNAPPVWMNWVISIGGAMAVVGTVSSVGFNFLIDDIRDAVESHIPRQLAALENDIATCLGKSEAAMLRWRDYDTLWAAEVAKRREEKGN